MLGTYIRKLRKGRKITLSQLAEKTNISKSYLSYIERNIQTNPSIGVLTKIAVALDADIQTLIEASASSSYERRNELTMYDRIDLIQKMVDPQEINEELLGEILYVIHNRKEGK